MVRHHQHTNTPPLVSVLLALFCAFVPPIIGGCSPLRDSCSCECFNIFIIICTNNMAASFNQTLKAHFHSIKKQIFQFKTWEWYCPTHTAAPVEAGLVAKRHQRGSERTDTHHTVTHYCDTGDCVTHIAARAIKVLTHTIGCKYCSIEDTDNKTRK